MILLSKKERGRHFIFSKIYYQQMTKVVLDFKTRKCIKIVFVPRKFLLYKQISCYLITNGQQLQLPIEKRWNINLYNLPRQNGRILIWSGNTTADFFKLLLFL